MLIAHSNLSVREIRDTDFENIVDYFLKSDKDFLLGMGVDVCKLPEKDEWLKSLSGEYQLPIINKKNFYVIWTLSNEPVGHSNINKIIYGQQAFMHLHLWQSGKRQKGMGSEFIKMSLPWYFDNFKLKKLYCEPYALNPAPNRALSKSGFDFIVQYETVPGPLNFHQLVNKWCLEFKKYQLLYGR